MAKSFFLAVAIALPGCVSLAIPARVPRARAPAPIASASASDDIVAMLDKSREDLINELELPSKVPDDEVSSRICLLYTEVARELVPAIFSADESEETRVAAIETVSCKLDVLEETIKGPLLTGSKPTVADAIVYPSMALFELSLPKYFGWEEWTNEALFYRRPRLHAWYELFNYERAAKTDRKALVQGVGEMDLLALAVEAPTSAKRTFPRHTN